MNKNNLNIFLFNINFKELKIKIDVQSQRMIRFSIMQVSLYEIEYLNIFICLRFLEVYLIFRNFSESNVNESYIALTTRTLNFTFFKCLEDERKIMLVAISNSPKSQLRKPIIFVEI